MVRVNGTTSEAFSIYPGVRQGCVLAANIFSTATGRITNSTSQALTLGVNYDDSGQLITDLDYADDIFIFSDVGPIRHAEIWSDLLIFNEQSQSFNPSAHGCPIHHQHSSELNLSQRPTIIIAHILAAPSPATTTGQRSLTTTIRKLRLGAFGEYAAVYNPAPKPSTCWPAPHILHGTTQHRRSQDFCLGGGTRPTPPSLASVVHTFEAVAGSR